MEEGIGAHGERLSELSGEIVALCGIVDDDHDDVKVSEAHADLAEGEVREVALKSSADGWLVGQVSGSRELYMLFDAKYTNLSEVHQEMLALKAQNFSNIFMD